jgi:hypothetical protein
VFLCDKWETGFVGTGKNQSWTTKCEEKIPNNPKRRRTVIMEKSRPGTAGKI